MDCSFQGWCALTPDAQAAWFQGIASVVAILIAIAVPATQHWLSERKGQRASELQARSLAISLLSDFQLVGERLNDVWGQEHPDSLPEKVYLGPVTTTALGLPARLAAMADRLHELGTASEPAQRLVYNVRRARDYLTVDGRGQGIVFDKPKFYDALNEATRASVSVLNRIDEMFKGPVAVKPIQVVSAHFPPDEQP